MASLPRTRPTRPPWIACARRGGWSPATSCSSARCSRARTSCACSRPTRACATRATTCRCSSWPAMPSKTRPSSTRAFRSCACRAMCVALATCRGRVPCAISTPPPGSSPSRRSTRALVCRLPRPWPPVRRCSPATPPRCPRWPVVRPSWPTRLTSRRSPMASGACSMTRRCARVVVRRDWSVPRSSPGRPPPNAWPASGRTCCASSRRRSVSCGP